MSHSVQSFADTFFKAANHAGSACMKLTHPSEYQYQLRHLRKGYIVDVYCRDDGGRRVVHDPSHKGPSLKLPDDWNLFDLVKAAIKKWNPPECCSDNELASPATDGEKAVIQADFRVPAVPPCREVEGGFLFRMRMPNGDGPLDIVLTREEIASAIVRGMAVRGVNGRL